MHNHTIVIYIQCKFHEIQSIGYLVMAEDGKKSLKFRQSKGNNSSITDGTHWSIPGCVAQSVTCLATGACLTADPGVASSIPVRSHTFVEIDHEIISTVILLPSADLFKKGCCQLQAKVCAQITG